MTTHLAGSAPDITLTSMDTRLVPAREQFEFWRSAYSGIDIQPRRGTSPRQFRGTISRLEDASGAALNRVACEANRPRFRATDEGVLLLGMLASPSGQVRYRCEGRERAVPCDRLYLLDTACEPEFVTDGFVNIVLTLPRSSVRAAQRGPAQIEDGLSLLPETPLTRTLKGHLSNATQELSGMSRRAGQLLLDTSVELANLALGQPDDADRHAGRTAGSSTVAVARRIMDENLEHPGFALGHLARRMGLGRRKLQSDLVRAGVSFSGELRTRRMKRAAELLSLTPLPVGEIALACGYVDFSAFSRAFRSHHGLPPRDYRVMRQEASL
ncbi:AraC family transcriptional regulator [Henriciella aquimarina]|uniref:AraC family transcriptional regulator n=1 Tax=Henriciella aquimarina TaxID=545261 RepID=UPI000A042750|nr:AraC family transcriptional regulator [Henriciella aquimarina]